MKKVLMLSVVLVAVIAITSCSTSYTTVATPKPTKNMVVTSGDLPNKDYTVLGFVESAASEMGFGFPTESKISEMKTDALNSGLVAQGERLGADAIINVSLTTATSKSYFVFLNTTIYAKGTAIKFK